MTCEDCGQDFQPARVYSPTAPNAPRFCSAVCRGRGYRKAKMEAVLGRLDVAEIAIREAKAMVGGGERKQ